MKGVMFRLALSAVLIALLLLMGSHIHSVLAQTANQSGSERTGVIDMLQEAMSNQKVLIAVSIQFLLGLGLGYYSAKVIKYLLALIGIIILGAVLSVWSLGGSIEGFIARLGTQAESFVPIIKGFMATLGILTVGPVTVGFLLGLIIALSRK